MERDLKDFTTEELTREIKRRKFEAMKERSRQRDPESMRRFFATFGSVNAAPGIDTQQLCREVRGKA